MQVSRLSVVALMCAMLGACSPNIAADDQEPPLGDIPTVISPDQIALPIYAFVPSVEQRVALMLVGQNLVNTCIESGGGQPTVQIGQVASDNEFGGDFQPVTPSGLAHILATYLEEDRTYSPLWGFFNPDTVAQYGYTRPPGKTTLAWQGSDHEDPAFESCLAQVDSVAPGGSALDSFMISDLPDGGPPTPTGDSRFVAVEQEWSTCMSQHGFDFATPKDAIGATWSPSTDSEKEFSKSVAIADVQCKIDTNLVGVAVAVLSAYEQRYIDDHRDALSELQTKIADYIAGRVSAPSPSPSSEPT